MGHAERYKMSRIKISGGCHCGRVAFEVSLADQIVVQICNCSICSIVGYVHLIVPAEDFQLLQGREFLTEYRFNSGTAKHLFCSRCGVKSFYVPRSNPDGFSINLRCLQLPTTVRVTEVEFDGRNWEQNSVALQQPSRAVGTFSGETD